MSVIKFQLEDGVATITLDNGKVNAFSHQMIDELQVALDQAEAAEAVVIITARPGILSAGFDLQVMMSDVESRADLVESGFAFAARLAAYPYAVVVACAGHAIAMGAMTLLSADCRIGADADYKIGLNEVQIGLTMPRVAISIARNRMPTNYLNRCLAGAEILSPQNAVTAGYLDQLVKPEDLMAEANKVAQHYAALNKKAFRETKAALNERLLAEIKVGAPLDRADFLAGSID